MKLLETRLNENKKDYELEKSAHLETLVDYEEKLVSYLESIYRNYLVIN
jgi:hypothetical protein